MPQPVQMTITQDAAAPMRIDEVTSKAYACTHPLCLIRCLGSSINPDDKPAVLARFMECGFATAQSERLAEEVYWACVEHGFAVDRYRREGVWEELPCAYHGCACPVVPPKSREPDYRLTHETAKLAVKMESFIVGLENHRKIKGPARH